MKTSKPWIIATLLCVVVVIGISPVLFADYANKIILLGPGGGGTTVIDGGGATNGIAKLNGTGTNTTIVTLLTVNGNQSVTGDVTISGGQTNNSDMVLQTASDPNFYIVDVGNSQTSVWTRSSFGPVDTHNFNFLQGGQNVFRIDTSGNLVPLGVRTLGTASLPWSFLYVSNATFSAAVNSTYVFTNTGAFYIQDAPAFGTVYIPIVQADGKLTSGSLTEDNVVRTNQNNVQLHGTLKVDGRQTNAAPVRIESSLNVTGIATNQALRVIGSINADGNIVGDGATSVSGVLLYQGTAMSLTGNFGVGGISTFNGGIVQPAVVPTAGLLDGSEGLYTTNVSGNIAMTLTNMADGARISLIVTNAGQNTISWNSVTHWPFTLDGNAPAANTNGLTLYTFWKQDTKTNGMVHQLPLDIRAGSNITLTTNSQNQITIASSGAGSGDVTKVGTPVANQVTYWTGDGTVAGSTNLLFNPSGNGYLQIGAAGFSGQLNMGGIAGVIDLNNGSNVVMNLVDEINMSAETLSGNINNVRNLTLKGNFVGGDSSTDTNTLNGTVNLPNLLALGNEAQVTQGWVMATNTGVINALQGPKQITNLTANTSFTVSGLSSNSAGLYLHTTQDATGGRTLTFNGTSIAIDTNANTQTDCIIYLSNGATNIACDNPYINAIADAGYLANGKMFQVTNGTDGYIAVIDTPSGGSGEANTASNLSVTNANIVGVFSDKSGVDLRFRTLQAGSNIVLTNEGTNIVIAGTSSGGSSIASFRQNPFLWEEYLGAPATTPFGMFMWVRNLSGAGSALTGAAVTTSENTAPGTVLFSTGTTTTGYAITYGSANILFGGGTYDIENRIYIPDLPTGAEDFTIRMGFNDSISGGEGTDSVFFKCSSTNANWECVTRSNSSETIFTTSTAVAADTWIKLRINVNAAGTSVDFVIDGSTVHTETSTIPVGSPRITQLNNGIEKTAGTTSRSFYIDYTGMEIGLTSSR